MSEIVKLSPHLVPLSIEINNLPAGTEVIVQEIINGLYYVCYNNTVIEVTPECLDLTKAKGEARIGTYYKTCWRFRYPPNSQCSVYLKKYDARIKKFTIVVLYDGREILSPIGYSLIPITEEEAQELTDHKRKAGIPETVVPTEDVPNLPDGSAPPLVVKQPKPKKEQLKTTVSASSIIKAGFVAGLSKEIIAQKVLAIYPDKEMKKLMAHINVLLYDYRKKNPNAVPQEDAAEIPAQEEPRNPQLDMQPQIVNEPESPSAE